jgi:outer membrane protein TolC
MLLMTGLYAGAGAVDPDPGKFPADPVLTDYLTWAAAHHPGVTRETGRASALRRGADQEGALPDLRFSWGEMIVPVETRVGPQRRILSLSQRIPWFGTLGLRTEVAAARAEAASQEIRALVNDIHHEIRAHWYDLAFCLGEIRIVTENLDLAHQAEASVRATYEAGAGPFGDVLAAQIDVEELTTRLAGLQDRIRPLTAKLNLAAGLPADHPAPRLSPDSLPRPDLRLPGAATLKSLLESHNPDLAAGKLKTASQRQAVDLAGKSAYPELMLGLDYIMTDPARTEGVADSGQDPVIARVALSLPLWGGKVQARKQAAADWLTASGADLAETRRQLNSRLETVLYSWREAERNADLYGQSLLASARQALEVTAAGYRSGQASYLDLVSARKTLLGIELAYLRALADQNHARNDLARLLGLSLEDLAAAGLDVSYEQGAAERENG